MPEVANMQNITRHVRLRKLCNLLRPICGNGYTVDGACTSDWRRQMFDFQSRYIGEIKRNVALESYLEQFVRLIA